MELRAAREEGEAVEEEVYWRQYCLLKPLLAFPEVAEPKARVDLDLPPAAGVFPEHAILRRWRCLAKSKLRVHHFRRHFDGGRFLLVDGSALLRMTPPAHMVFGIHLGRLHSSLQTHLEN